MSDRNECPTCGLKFNSTAAFARHRVGDFNDTEKKKPSPYGPVRRCMTVAEMEERGMSISSAGYWITAAREWEQSIAGRAGN